MIHAAGFDNGKRQLGCCHKTKAREKDEFYEEKKEDYGEKPAFEAVIFPKDEPEFVPIIFQPLF